MPRFIAAFLVFVSSAAVLVLEILAARLLAPYVGVTLQVYTAIIGVVLAGIAVGSWWGGKAADRVDPRTLIGPLIVAGGVLSWLTIPLIDVLGSGLRGAGAGTTVALTFIGFFTPAAVLTAVTPAVIKIQLASLDETGRVVGRLSAIGTAGAIFGTFVTGFVLIAAWPTRPIIRVVGLILVGLGIAVTWWLQRRRATALSVVGIVMTGGLSFVAPHPCEHESAYFCAYVQNDPSRASGRVLWLDTLRHSYVDLDDPAHLEFAYTSWFGDVIEAIAPNGEALDVLHIGGGAMTMPQYLRHEHPGSTSVVLELDALLVDLAERKFGFVPGDDIIVITGDARTGIANVSSDTFDLAIGDAFGGVAVPWHLATKEFTAQLHDRLRPGGIYVMNVLDHGDKRFLRAQIATVSDTFRYVAVVARPGAFDDYVPGQAVVGGNHVVVASDAPLPLAEVEQANRRRAQADVIFVGVQLDTFARNAVVLTDDYAPVDQLITPLPPRS